MIPVFRGREVAESRVWCWVLSFLFYTWAETILTMCQELGNGPGCCFLKKKNLTRHTVKLITRERPLRDSF